MDNVRDFISGQNRYERELAKSMDWDFVEEQTKGSAYDYIAPDGTKIEAKFDWDSQDREPLPGVRSDVRRRGHVGSFRLLHLRRRGGPLGRGERGVDEDARSGIFGMIGDLAAR